MFNPYKKDALEFKVKMSANKQEFFQVIEGSVRLHDAKTGEFVEIHAGNAGIIPPSFKGTFEVLEKVKKYYVLTEN